MCIAAALAPPPKGTVPCAIMIARAITWPVLHRYYFLTSLSISPWWKKLVTTSQIAQFVFRWACCSPFSNGQPPAQMGWWPLTAVLC